MAERRHPRAANKQTFQVDPCQEERGHSPSMQQNREVTLELNMEKTSLRRSEKPEGAGLGKSEGRALQVEGRARGTAQRQGRAPYFPAASGKGVEMGKKLSLRLEWGPEQADLESPREGGSTSGN